MDRGAPGGHAQQAARRVLSAGLRDESWALSGGAPPSVGRIAQKVVGLLERLVLGEGDDDGGLAAGADDDNLLVVVDDGVEDLGVVVVRLVVGHSLHGASAFRQRVPPPADGRVRVYVAVTGGLRGPGPCCAQGVSSGRARTFRAAPELAARWRQRRGRSCRRRRGPRRLVCRCGPPSRRRRVRSRLLSGGFAGTAGSAPFLPALSRPRRRAPPCDFGATMPCRSQGLAPQRVMKDNDVWKYGFL